MQREKKERVSESRRADSSSAENRRRISYTQNENGYIQTPRLSNRGSGYPSIYLHACSQLPGYHGKGNGRILARVYPLRWQL